MSKTGSTSPYISVLGFPPEFASPNYYQFLGLEEFTDDSQAIMEALTRLNRKLQSLQNNADLYDDVKLLEQELGTASIVLRNPEKKREYDRQLKQRDAQAQETFEFDTETVSIPQSQTKPAPFTNPYAAFLGLPEGITPPNLYELLNLEDFTHDPELIRKAAEVQRQKLQRWQEHERHHKSARRLLKQVILAERTLTDEDQRIEYDRKLIIPGEVGEAEPDNADDALLRPESNDHFEADGIDRIFLKFAWGLIPCALLFAFLPWQWAFLTSLLMGIFLVFDPRHIFAAIVKPNPENIKALVRPLESMRQILSQTHTVHSAMVGKFRMLYSHRPWKCPQCEATLPIWGFCMACKRFMFEEPLRKWCVALGKWCVPILVIPALLVLASTWPWEGYMESSTPGLTGPPSDAVLKMYELARWILYGATGLIGVVWVAYWYRR